MCQLVPNLLFQLARDMAGKKIYCRDRKTREQLKNEKSNRE